jgi:hypothetical protein
VSAEPVGPLAVELSDAAIEVVAAQTERGYEPVQLRQLSLTPLQRDILELEDASFNRPGEKLSEFKRRHPGVTEVGYGVALLRLLSDPRAYEYDNGRYAGTLARIQRLHAEVEAHRARLRGDVVDQ